MDTDKLILKSAISKLMQKAKNNTDNLEEKK